jgi:hypothetical protein
MIRDQTCRLLQTYHQYFAVATQLFVGSKWYLLRRLYVVLTEVNFTVLQIMRVYALYNKSRRVLGLLCLTGSFVVACGCVSRCTLFYLNLHSNTGFKWSIISGKKSSHMALQMTSNLGCTHALTETEHVFSRSPLFHEIF